MAFKRRGFRSFRRRGQTTWLGLDTVANSQSRTTNGTTEMELVDGNLLSVLSGPVLVNFRYDMLVRVSSIDADVTHSADWQMGIIFEDRDATTPPDLGTRAGWERSWLWTKSGRVITPHTPVFNGSITLEQRHNGTGLDHQRVTAIFRGRRRPMRHHHMILCFNVLNISASTTIGITVCGGRALFQEA